jgi:hypothetical protein
MTKLTHEELLDLIGDKSYYKIGTVWRHIKTGDTYISKGIALDEATMTVCIIYYKADEEDIKWVRPYSIFNSRFQRIA